MVRKSTPVEKAARMLDLVPYISSHQGIETSELAKEFGISEEELLNDLNSLWMCGDNRFDLIELQFESGYVTIRNAETLNLIRSLSQQEIISLLLGLDLIEKNLPHNRGDLAQEISQLRNRLGNGLARILDATPSLDSQIVQVIQEALSTQRRIAIEYLSPTEDQLSQREVTPLNLFSEGERDFLLAFCEMASAHRTFRVDRIQSARLLEVTARAVVDQPREALLEKYDVAIHRHLRRCREALGDFLSGQGSAVTVSSYNSDWLLRTVMASGGAMEVTSSPEMRERIVQNATKALELYR